MLRGPGDTLRCDGDGLRSSAGDGLREGERGTGDTARAGLESAISKFTAVCGAVVVVAYDEDDVLADTDDEALAIGVANTTAASKSFSS